MTLTNSAIAAMLPGDELKDHLVPGLSVRCHGAGRSFMLYYRTKTGRVRRPKLGDCSVLSLADARDLARDWLGRVAKGEDPAGAQAASRDEPTMDELWHRCEREHWTDTTKGWAKEAKRLWTLHAKPKIGKTHVRALTYADVSGVHQALKAHPVQANRVVAVVSKMLALAERWELRASGSNPCQHLERYPERSRKRFARRDELPAIGAALDRYAQDPAQLTGVIYLYLMLFTGARPTELERATPAMLERHIVTKDGVMTVYGVLRIEEGKTGERDVFVPPQAMALLDQLPAKRENLTGRRQLPRTLWRKLRKEAGCSDLWVRDLRRTFATVGYSSGVDKKVVGNLLGHASPATTEIYAKLMEDVQHSAAEATATKMAELLTGR